MKCAKPIFDDSADNGFVQLRRNLLTHLQDGRLNKNESLGLLLLIMTASASTGTTKTCASAIASALMGLMTEREAQKSLNGLEQKGYIHRDRLHGDRNIYPITVNKYLLTMGPNAGKLVQLTEPKMSEKLAPLRVPSRDCHGYRGGTVTGTDNGTVNVFVNPDTTASYADVYSAKGTDVGTVAGTDVAPSRTPSRDCHGYLYKTDTENEKEKETASCFSSCPVGGKPHHNQPSHKEQRGAGAEPRVTTGDSQRPTAVNPAASIPSALAIAVPSAIKGMHPPRVTAEDFDAVDFAFLLKKPIAGYSPKEIRRITWWHWRQANNKYWSKPEARVDSPARFESVLSKMAEQVPEFFRMTGEVTCQIPVADPACTGCSGTGSTTVDHPSYPAGMYQASDQCACVHPHPYPWRLVRNEAAA